jgi:putative NIF3 family GTP cyclohydrolase 1 type 2
MLNMHTRFAAALSLPLLFSLHPQAQTLTAADALQQIKARYPAKVAADTVDTVKAGDPSTPLTGIATTFLDTMDVLREANGRGLNLVITHEPTFYNHRDDTTFFTDDPVYKQKLAFIQQHHMVVFRLHDEIHDVSPDPIATALINALGWQHYTTTDDPFHATIPAITLGALSRQLQQKFNVGTIRVVGDPNLQITHVAMLPGASGLQKHVIALRRPDVDLLIAGEASEWETVEYVRDAVAQGRHKALILLGHEVSEEPGMLQCSKDLHALFPSLKVEDIPAGSPLWNPEHPPASK